MKKLYKLLMAAVLTMAVALPAVAAPSPEAETIDPDPAPAYSSTVTTTVSGVTLAEPSKELSDEVVRVTSNAQVLKDLNVSSSARLAAVVDVSYSGVIPAGGVQIPFDASAFAKKGDLVYVLHRQAAAPYTWEVVGQSVLGDDLKVTGTFKSFSPGVFMVLDASQVASVSGTRAPRTGEY